MLSFIQIVLITIVLYSLTIFILERYDYLPEWYCLSGPLALLRSNAGVNSVKNIADSNPRFWRGWGTAGVVLSILGMFISAALITISALERVTKPKDVVFREPQNFLIVPGVNEFLPLEAAPELILALLITLVVHEAGHGILCRIGDIDIKSTGIVLFSYIPIGAFVEPDRESQNKASKPKRLRMFAAGVMNNIGFSIIGLFLFFIFSSAFITTAPGAPIGGVLSGGPADKAGIESGDRITSVNGVEISDKNGLINATETNKRNISVTINDNEQKNISRFVIVNGATPSTDLSSGDVISKINGKPVYTVNETERILNNVNDFTVDILKRNGNKTTIPIGALITVQDNSPLNSGPFEKGESYIIVEMNGERIHNTEDLQKTIEEIDTGDRINVTRIKSDNGNLNTESYEFTLNQTNNQKLKIGIVSTPKFSGTSLVDVGVRFYPSEQYLSIISWNPLDGVFSFAQKTLSILALPIAGIITGTGFHFSGFTPEIQNYYSIVGVSGILEKGIFFIVSTVFWSSWIGINVAIFNMLPTFALDGGHILQDVLKIVGEKVPKFQKIEMVVIYSVKSLTLGVLLVLLFAPLL